MIIRFAIHLVIASLTLAVASARFIHPGCLSTEADLQRMAAKVAAGEDPWKSSWDILVKNTDGFLNHPPETQSPIKAGGGRGENYIRLARDCARAYQLALRFRGSGDERFAKRSVKILNAWAAGHNEWAGDSNVCLRAGIYGYQLACTAELLRDFRGWERSDFRKFQDYLKERFYHINHDFLIRHNGTVDEHYWANWDLANMASMIAIGVVCDDRKIFDEAVAYFHKGQGTGALRNAVVFMHPDGLGQWQESGRDQGHSLMGPQLMGSFCEIAWNQGLDLYGALDYRLLAGVEYVSKYNLGHEVPFVTYLRDWGHPGKEKLEVHRRISEHGRGLARPGWDLLFNHHARRRGIAAPWTEAYAEKARPEGGGFNYGGSSGGFDGLGFTTLTHSLDSLDKSAPPGALRATVMGRQITLSWLGSAGAVSHTVKRSQSKGGPYTPIATVEAPEMSFIDTGLEAGTTYYYGVSADLEEGEGPTSAPLAVTADHQLDGSVIGTDGSFRNCGLEKETVFDGSLESYFDPPGENAWVGLDLGPDTTAVVTGVRYCPRKGAADRMVGGRFQGSKTPDFSGEVVDLLRVKSKPADEELTEASIQNKTPFRYLRYIPEKGGWCNVAEIRFLGDPGN
ncbi:hypothetical protein HNR46_003718 [Haloferula luteola]|uniref:Fibronectin type-III domain-containing protein n=1 Tax=Haloferula luteola TaxID=595692 RepID=A0A840V5D6_9BACT|nr:alginate lyase family protein [Haloferula luteola]MBB5353457.1 hypothetical protein [Haloferula luteola]